MNLCANSMIIAVITGARFGRYNYSKITAIIIAAITTFRHAITTFRQLSDMQQTCGTCEWARLKLQL